MPVVKKSTFTCPICGGSTRVLRTRKASSRLVRYRICTAGHRVTTQESAAVAIGTNSLKVSIADLVKNHRPNNLTEG